MVNLQTILGKRSVPIVWTVEAQVWLGYKDQRSACNICVTHVHGRVALRVVTLFGPAWERFLSCKLLNWQLNDMLNHIVLTFQYAENVEDAPMEMWVQQAGGDELVRDATKNKKHELRVGYGLSYKGQQIK